MSESEAVPPRPAEILDDDRIQYQAMTDLSDDEYRRLAEDIRERGVLQPIITDETGTILDGHHRAALAEWLNLDESRQPAYVVIGDLKDEDEKLARAIKQNVIGRDTSDAVKTHAVNQYIQTVWDRTDDGDLIRPETDTEVAEKLGVSQQLVTRVCKNTNGGIITHDRVKAREYYEDNPDASYREVAQQVDASNKTVTEWLKEDFDEGDESDAETSLTAFARDDSEAEKAAETFDTAKNEDADDKVQQTAEQQAEHIARGQSDPADARKEVELAANREDEQPTTETPPLPDETYRTVVIDPPWDMEKIERKERPQQGQFLDYPTMGFGELQDLPIGELAADSGAHLFVWTTQKRLFDAFRLVASWGGRYECLLTWVKPTGVTPFSWQYNTEHVVFARFGDGLQLDEQGLPLSFEAPVTEHSEKPTIFYDRVRQSSPEPRLEMFARTRRDGFDVWGNEV